MRFEKLSVEEMEKVVSDLVEEKVVYQSQDIHAVYFDGESGNEYKMVLDQEECLYERESGKEDWNMVLL